MAKVQEIALAFPAAVPHLGRVLRGIAEYAQRHARWTFVLSPETFVMRLQSLKGWGGHGVIALIDTKAEAQAARKLGVPVVNLSGALRDAGLPRVMVDHQAVGRLAAEHLLERGFRRFAYYGVRDLWYARQRRGAFIERLKRDGRQCSVHEVPSSIIDRQPWHHGQQQLASWLKTLELPVGLMACTDQRAQMVTETCRRLGLDVPGDVAIIGVDNDEITCRFCVPPLSSVSRNGNTVGYEAAALLDRLMSGKRPPAGDVLIAPDGVVKRRSTDVVAVDDPHVAAAIRFIREHVSECFGVDQVAAALPVSRRYLEHRFRRHLGCTPHQYICRVRVERAKQLLGGAEKMKLKHIATACGFNDPMRLRLVFERITSMTPREYRRSHPPEEVSLGSIGG